MSDVVKLAQRIHGQVGNQIRVAVTRPVLVRIISQAEDPLEDRVFDRCAGPLKDHEDRIRILIRRQTTEDYDGSSST